jgi:hypothetical protein
MSDPEWISWLTYLCRTLPQLLSAFRYQERIGVVYEAGGRLVPTGFMVTLTNTREGGELPKET